tara:strand:- start:408 stop:680 length:273 start_codon:yes stop_codon:yes gene_type:complete
MKIKQYIVTLLIRNGEYEKSADTLRTAETPEAATRAAQLGQCHHKIGEGAQFLPNGSLEDAYGELVYEPKNVVLVEPGDVATLAKYLPVH